jgi:small subunit ribosomal protein S10
MKYRIFLKSFDSEVISSCSEQLVNWLSKVDCKVNGIVALPVRIRKFCVLRSPHIDKDSREHFEVRVYKRFLDITTDSPVILDPILRMELPPGIACSLKVLES